MMRLTILFAAASLAIVPSAASAQQGQLRENAAYYRVVLTEIKPGKRDRAETIIEEHFMKAGVAARTPLAVTYHAQSGDWDFLTLFPMPGGPADLAYSETPAGQRWWQALVAQTGSEEAAQKLMQEFNSLVADSTSFIAHRHLGAQ